MMPNRLQESPVRSIARPGKSDPEMESRLRLAADALSELYQLLEEYGPSWYTKGHHERAEAALLLLRNR